MSPAWVDLPSKTTMRCLQGRGTPLSWYVYFLTSSDNQPRNSLAGDFVNSHKAYIISAVSFCLICGKHITCEVSRGYRARDSACFGIHYLINFFFLLCTLPCKKIAFYYVCCVVCKYYLYYETSSG